MQKQLFEKNEKQLVFLTKQHHRFLSENSEVVKSKALKPEIIKLNELVQAENSRGGDQIRVSIVACELDLVQKGRENDICNTLLHQFSESDSQNVHGTLPKVLMLTKDKIY